MSTENVSCSKTLVGYNVSKSYTLILSKEFCVAHLPRHDKDVILVDESEEEFVVKFLAKHRILSRGWRDFVNEHDLLEGDKVSFHLIRGCEFKVHITRASRTKEIELQNNVPVSVVKGEHLAEENTCFGDTVTKQYLVSCVGDSHKKDIMLYQNKKRVHEEVVSKEKVYINSRSTRTSGAGGTSFVNVHDCSDYDVHTKIVAKELLAVDVSDKTLLEPDHDTKPLAGQSVSVACSESALSLKSFENFKINVDGENLDSEIPQDARMKYHQLCCSQKKLIHDRVMKGISSKFAVAVILEIVRIADSTRAATMSTFPSDLESMGKTLQSFEELGFAVGSLRAKIATLTEFSREHQALAEKAEKLIFVFNKVAGLTW